MEAEKFVLPPEKPIPHGPPSTGTFILYVPKGTYSISLITPGMMEYVEVPDNNQSVETTQNRVAKVKFTITVEEKRVEYKKFSSN